MPGDKTAPVLPYSVTAYALMHNLSTPENGSIHRQIVRDFDGDYFWRLIPRDGAPSAWMAGNPIAKADRRPQPSQLGA